jgi:hypothetical protein
MFCSQFCLCLLFCFCCSQKLPVVVLLAAHSCLPRNPHSGCVSSSLSHAGPAGTLAAVPAGRAARLGSDRPGNGQTARKSRRGRGNKRKRERVCFVLIVVSRPAFCLLLLSVSCSPAFARFSYIIFCFVVLKSYARCLLVFLLFVLFVSTKLIVSACGRIAFALPISCCATFSSLRCGRAVCSLSLPPPSPTPAPKYAPPSASTPS